MSTCQLFRSGLLGARSPLLVRARSVIGVALCAAAAVHAQPQPPRDRLPQQTGTGRIKGRIVDAQTGSAVPRARVRIMGLAGLPPPVSTDESGGFEFANLPAGRFFLSAERVGYAVTHYPERGQTIRGGNRPLMVADRETVAGLVIPLYRGAAITGRVIDRYGDPTEFAHVQVFRVPAHGRGMPMQRGGAGTNDLGEFRVPKLEPGSYVLLAAQRQLDDASDAQPLPTYFPSAVSLAEAQPIRVERAQTVAGIEIVLVDALASVVSGTVLDSKGQPVQGGSIQVRRVSSEVRDFGAFGGGLRPDGTFRLKLAPGEYDLEVHGARSGGMGPPRKGEEQFGVLRVTATGAPMADLTIQLGPAAVVTGRLIFDGSSPLPDDPQSVRIGLGSTTPYGMCQPGVIEVSPDWTFRIDGAIGACNFMPMGVGRWTMRSAGRDEINLVDQAIRFSPGQVWRDIEVVFTDRRTELTLDVADEHGLPTREYVAVVFARDKKRWAENSRYVRLYVPPPPPVAPASTNGALSNATTPQRPDSISALPPGEYYVAVVDDLPNEGARDAALLESLVSGATRVTLTDTAPVRIAVRRGAAPHVYSR
jgi:hypothetical protein